MNKNIVSYICKWNCIICAYIGEWHLRTYNLFCVCWGSLFLLHV